MKRFVTALQSDKKLAIIWHWSSRLLSGPIVHFINTQKPSSLHGDWKGGFAENPPSPSWPFLFLAGIRGSVTVILEAQLGVGGGWENWPGIREPESHHVSGCASEARSRKNHTSGGFNNVSLGQRESLSLRWARPVAARGPSVGIVWKLVQLEIPAAEWGEGEESL